MPHTLSPAAIKGRFTDYLKSIDPSSPSFANSPGKDFTRNRKCPFSSLIQTLILSENHSLNTEIRRFFDFSHLPRPSKSAFVQQRSKLSPDALPTVFSGLNSVFPFKKRFMGMHILACDGSDVNLPPLPDDTDHRIPYNSRNGHYFQIHLNAVFDILEQRYTDASLQPRALINENAALCDMVDRNHLDGPCLFIADRGFSSFNLLAHIQENSQFFLIRQRSVLSRFSPWKSLVLPDTGEFDLPFTLKISRHKSPDPEVHVLNKQKTFDFLDPDHGSDVYPIPLRLVRVRLSDSSFEYLVTNLPARKFPLPVLKQLYRMRWDIETSFRALKYNVALNSFHCKKREFIRQEVFARLIMYNFTALLVGTIKIEQGDTKYIYQISFADAVVTARGFLLNLYKKRDIKNLLLRNKHPIRPGRHFPRNVRSQKALSLNNRT